MKTYRVAVDDYDFYIIICANTIIDALDIIRIGLGYTQKDFTEELELSLPYVQGDTDLMAIVEEKGSGYFLPPSRLLNGGSYGKSAQLPNFEYVPVCLRKHYIDLVIDNI